MAKTYINTVKYEIRLKFEIDGIVDKPDIIGAIFGQSEGLLGDEMDLKELQKNGKVGRIEIEHTTSMGRTKGSVVVPSSMDMAETSLLAAGIESVDKVGPCESKFEIVDIADTRTDKRGEIKSRAQELLKKMMERSRPDTQMLSEEIRESVRASDITEYGPDKLPSGPGIENDSEIIIVEGRADVLNMLRNQIRNVVGMNGSNIPPTIIELSRHKEVTAFVDGDRGGTLNARKLAQLVNVDFIAKAPDGKEVEELTRKEILQSLKKKAPAEEELRGRKPGFAREPYPRDRGPRERRERSWSPGRTRENAYAGRPREHGFSSRSPPRESGTYSRRPQREAPYSRQPPMRQPRGRPPREIPKEYVPRERPVLTPEEQQAYKPILEELKGSMSARLLDAKNEVVKEVKVKDMVSEVGKSRKKINAVVFDGVITKRLVEAAEKAGVNYVIGARKGKIDQSEKVKAAAL